VEQISLIQPVVIVTLGNFATKYVLQTQQGITRMRGSVYPWHGRKVIPTFHPAAILHGGGEKSRQFAELQEDFALIRRELTEPPPPPPVVSLLEPKEPVAAAPDDDQLELF
jgi:DNA polymerase